MNGRSRRLLALVLLLLAAGTTGCMYREETHSPGSYRQSVMLVQDAVDQYQQATGLLPIENSDQSVPRYEKFRIDLDKLHREGYLDEIPSAAFEKGGSAYFLLQDEETAPTVKLIDLVTVQAVNDVQREVQRYRMSHGGSLPLEEELYPGLFAIDYGKLKQRQAKLASVYSQRPLTLLMDGSGGVYADYAEDIITAIQKNGSEPAEDEDLRQELTQASYYVPAKSLPYRWIQGSPVPQTGD
ncbi:DUF3939 domain-containing protein [Paenibacillus sp. NFR01]|uniref:DUF3939 domain-containing protein n=1 Tax=Paenibacillus sp. NFR01 TaxID=1566279 RepID=UPI0008B46222|nr:DUF3939 domain-containing protein [Paenibacillus sp. NFR01]SET52939.1 Protein of unknown function [Paenibacillus sp. NFR01]